MGRINENIADFRRKAGMTQEELGEKIGKKRSTIQGYESGGVEITYSMVEKIAAVLGVSIGELAAGRKENRNAAGKIKIYNLEDRLSVAQILIKNGYTVAQGKEKRTPDGRSLVYYLSFREDKDNADTSH